jgi:hypothetical protein
MQPSPPSPSLAPSPSPQPNLWIDLAPRLFSIKQRRALTRELRARAYPDYFRAEFNLTLTNDYRKLDIIGRNKSMFFYHHTIKCPKSKDPLYNPSPYFSIIGASQRDHTYKCRYQNKFTLGPQTDLNFYRDAMSNSMFNAESLFIKGNLTVVISRTLELLRQGYREQLIEHCQDQPGGHVLEISLDDLINYFTTGPDFRALDQESPEAFATTLHACLQNYLTSLVENWDPGCPPIPLMIWLLEQCREHGISYPSVIDAELDCLIALPMQQFDMIASTPTYLAVEIEELRQLLSQWLTSSVDIAITKMKQRQR